ncbi:MAG: DUF4358 domain-containing protein [Oscillospiraceae bacterium]
MNKRLWAASLLICAAVASAAMTGCSSAKAESSGSTESTESQAAASVQESEKSAKDILQEISSADEAVNFNASAYFDDDIFKKNCKKLYSFDIDKLSDGGIIYVDSGGLADEISLIKPADGDTAYALKALEARKQLRIQDFTGYKPEELDKIENAQIFEAGGYAVFIISDNAEQLAEKIRTMMQKG